MLSAQARTLASIAVLLAVNAYVCQELFSAEFVGQMGSTEGAFITISRWAMRHWGDLSWFPLWFTGMPFFRIYQPGLHLTVAAIATFLHLTVQRAFHLVDALVYCLQPVTFFWLCYRVTGWRGYAFAAGLAYSLISPSAFLVPLVRHELGGIWFARRYQALIFYGDAPHNAVLLLLPVAILFLHKAVTESNRWYFSSACVVLAAIALTNWPGMIGLSMALIAYCLSRAGDNAGRSSTILIASGLIAYLMACRWIPPSTILRVLDNSQQSDGTVFNYIHLVSLLTAGLVSLGMHLLFQRFRIDRWLRFFLYFVLISGLVTLARFWGGVNLLPQGHRFHLEMEMAMIGAAVFLVRLSFIRWPPWIRTVAVVFLSLAALLQLHNYRKYARSQTLPLSVETTVEYRMSEWLQAHMPDARVFVPGSVSIWLNAFSDVPQIAGCCDQGVPSFSHRLAYYTLYSAQNAGDRYIPVALLWLKAYGAQAIAVTGPGGKEFFKPYARPEAFRGALPEVWREGDDVIYEVPTRSPSLAHVMEPSELASRSPSNGLDTEPLIQYVSALDRADSTPASFRWINPHQARIDTNVRTGQVLSVQITYDPGWQAMVNGGRQPTRPDGIGLLTIEPSCNGPCNVDLVFDEGREAHWTRWAQVLGLVLCFAWPVAGPITRKLAASPARLGYP